jgi:hypothetical protein
MINSSRTARRRFIRGFLAIERCIIPFDGFGNMLMGDLPHPATLEQAERDPHGIAKPLTTWERPPALEQAKGITQINSRPHREILQRELHGAPGVRLPGPPAIPVLVR